ncbi:unnamed protein product [Penicillium salamii]|uniref:Uncharacterized protein n=3 Tax=Penicillium TaxID=5073 RepID=A0A1V6WFN8_PENNA|nr:hypothetical protein CBS147333_10104 [Penicillium roqueforti]OQE61731.1 hypothetical protein PENNAL_c0278G03536 [Penicillium nalgiovense]CAG7935421.1 unnamed protein product [Penicillium salamii]KAI3128008.1 hypothetical protein CBS147325_9928 [Penicillium roqueforti]KAI3154656.1 hypothetical protein DTO046C5_8645 [Penicillium roqueforti]
MATRTIQLVSFRNVSSQRAHFAIFVPSAADPKRGTLIHAVGAPMAGYILEFKRNYSPAMTQQRHETFPIGQVYSSNIVDSVDTAMTKDSTPRGNIEIAASQVPTPGISQNFMAPVNDTTNKRCQEWTMEFVRHLVSKGLIAAEAIQIVQSKRDPPNHGIGLQPAARR